MNVNDATRGAFEEGLDGRWRRHVVGITTLESLVARGRVYTAVEAATSMADSEYFEIFAETSENFGFIEELSISGTASQVVVTLYEDSVKSSGTPLSQFNHSRVAHKAGVVSPWEMEGDPVLSVQGTPIFQKEYFGQAVQGSTPDYFNVTLKPQLFLAPNTGYVARVTNTSGSLANLEATLLYGAARDLRG